ncbi:MAG: chaperone NapD [Gammaproteobacteria bacterium]|nr:chaperone NapD [Gammaproteobacteria bacterium]
MNDAVEENLQESAEEVEEEKFNIVGVVVNTRVEAHEEIQSAIATNPGVEVCAAESGKLVITIDEVECEQSLVDTITLINNIPGVLATSIAYHHFEGGLANQEKKV